MLQNKIIRILLGITLGVFVALIIAPQTRWLVRYQTLSALHLAPVPGTENEAVNPSRVQDVADQEPGNYQTQLGAINWICDSKVQNSNMQGERVSNSVFTVAALSLGKLEKMSPHSASLLANILRVDCNIVYADEMRDARLFDPKDYYQDGGNQYHYHTPLNIPSVLANFIDTAQEGRRLEPKNAFFGLMLAYGYYASNQYSAAESTLLLAGKDTYWDNYSSSSTVEQWNVLSKVDGDESSVLKYVVRATQSHADYARLRELARFTGDHAAFYTSSGQVQKGIALRQAIIHCGYLLYRAPSNYEEGRVGIAMSAISMLHAGPRPVLPTEKNDSVAGRIRYLQEDCILTQNIYITYLIRHGDIRDAKVVEAEGIGGPAGLRALNNVSALRTFSRFQQITLLWILCLALVGNVACVVVIMVLTVGTRAGGANAGRLSAFRRVAVAMLWLTAVLMVCSIGCWIGRAVWSEILIYTGVPYLSFSPPKFYFLFALLTLSAPLLLVIVSIARMGRAPIRHTLASAALPAVCVLLLLYTGIVAGIARQERSLNGLLTQQQQSASQDVAANSVRGALTRVG